jgi:hypothetical protein
MMEALIVLSGKTKHRTHADRVRHGTLVTPRLASARFGSAAAARAHAGGTTSAFSQLINAVRQNPTI